MSWDAEQPWFLPRSFRRAPAKAPPSSWWGSRGQALGGAQGLSGAIARARDRGDPGSRRGDMAYAGFPLDGSGAPTNRRRDALWRADGGDGDPTAVARLSKGRAARPVDRGAGGSGSAGQVSAAASGRRIAPGLRVPVSPPTSSPENVPGLPAISLIHALLVKSACLGKPASEEPVFPALFARSIAAVDAKLARAVAVLPWPGGNYGIEQAAFGASQAVIASGSDEAIESISRARSARGPFCRPRPQAELRGDRARGA